MNKTFNKKYRTLDEIEEGYFRDHPEEIAPYIEEIFDEYARDGNSAALMTSLRIIAKVEGIQCTFPDKASPGLDDVNTILKMLGYRLAPEPLKNGKL